MRYIQYNLYEGRQWAGLGWFDSFLFGPWAQWTGHSGLLTRQ